MATARKAKIKLTKNFFCITTVGSVFLKIRHFFKLSIKQRIIVWWSKLRMLNVGKLKPILNYENGLEVHVLLCHRDACMALWSMYSFAHFYKDQLQFVVHDDGTLTFTDVERLEYVFPGIRVVLRSEADAVVEEQLKKRNLSRCLQTRRRLCFMIKLIDVLFFGRKDRFMLLDSDVLFFSSPIELREILNNSNSYYLSDPAPFYAYCIDQPKVEAMLGKPIISNFNPGVLMTRKSEVSLQRIEKYLTQPEFINADGVPNYFTELTLWAMELTNGGHAYPFSSRYGFAYSSTRDLVSVHYCGSVKDKAAFYTEGFLMLEDLLNKCDTGCRVGSMKA